MTMAFADMMGKGENAGYQHFLLFPSCLLPVQRHLKFSIFLFSLTTPHPSPPSALDLEEPKTLSFGKRANPSVTLSQYNSKTEFLTNSYRLDNYVKATAFAFCYFKS